MVRHFAYTDCYSMRLDWETRKKLIHDHRNRVSEMINKKVATVEKLQGLFRSLHH